MKKNLFLRIVFYVAGLLILALGIILNTKSGLGVSPIISVAYSIATIGGFNFGNITFLLYSAFVVVEIVLHIFRNHRYSGEAGGAIAPAAHRDLKLVLVMDLLQLPLSLVFTRFMNLFSALLPTPSDNMPSRLLVLAAGIILTGIGAAMSLNMRIIPNPGDGIVQAISDCIGKSVGFTKNCFDLFNICLTTSIGLLFAHKLIGIGLGTVIAVLGVGRVIAVFNRLFMKKMTIVHDISLRALCPIFRTVADSCIHCSLMISTGMGGLFGRFTYSDWITRYL